MLGKSGLFSLSWYLGLQAPSFVSRRHGLEEGLEVQGELLLQDSFLVWEPKSLIRKGRDRHLFLFELSLIFSKEIKDSSGRTKYLYKSRLRTPELIVNTGGGWSAPSAIGIAGLGGGFEIGVEVSDLVIILNQRRAVEAFTKGGNLTLGGNCTVAGGPMGRNVEADVAIRSTAAIFTYCHSRGLFAGISLEGSGLIERKETNRKFYSQDIRASAILNGDVEPPSECYDLYHILESYTDAYAADWTTKNIRPRTSLPPSRPPAPSQKRAASVYQPPVDRYQPPVDRYQPPVDRYQPPVDRYQPPPTKNVLYPSISVYKSETSGGGASGELVVTAIHAFSGQQPGDLSFVPGDRITVVTKTDSEYDWWEGRLEDGTVGIFPANFVSQ
ncbi:SH3 domain-containing YSC84-like protein 1 [Perca flavescens]|uniref:SH3 domain-containing YSC84-like protein 1 n=1 Tax=Perca flavescens TaxID=8167 RepID=UPI00106DF885|nr:SH3 domain-containing YSC84-like protein 1 [Perca flavescens]